MTPKNLLALDTSTEACSAALLIEGKVIERFEVKPNQHSQLILPMIDDLLSEAGWTVSSLHQKIEAVVWGCGPGSFTGLRIAASIVQGITFAHQLPVIPVSSLQTMAQAAYEEFGYAYVLSAIDAHVQSMYYGAFVLDETDSIMKPLGEEVLVSPEKWMYPNEAANFQWSAVGTGWHYFNGTPEKLSAKALVNYYPKASALLKIAEKLLEQGLLLSPEETLPVYLHELEYAIQKR